MDDTQHFTVKWQDTGHERIYNKCKVYDGTDKIKNRAAATIRPADLERWAAEGLDEAEHQGGRSQRQPVENRQVEVEGPNGDPVAKRGQGTGDGPHLLEGVLLVRLGALGDGVVKDQGRSGAVGPPPRRGYAGTAWGKRPTRLVAGRERSRHESMIRFTNWS